MNRLSSQKVTLGQANGPEVELVVDGDNEYASYETPDGFPVIYDDALGLFCYAKLDDGRFQSTKVPVAEQPPASSPRHGRESKEVRDAKRARVRAEREARARSQRSIPP